jgi:hypothetical protein
MMVDLFGVEFEFEYEFDSAFDLATLQYRMIYNNDVMMKKNTGI